MNQTETDNITWALGAFREVKPGSSLTRVQRFAFYRDYYEGRHKLTFATQKFMDTFGDTFQAMAENLCPAVVDSVTDRLQLQGFTAASGADAARVAAECQEIRRRNRMDRRDGEKFRDALICGENYVMVWPDRNDRTKPIIYPQTPENVVVKYHDEQFGFIIQAAKFWIEKIGKDSQCRLNLYFPDRIEKYVSTGKATTLPEKATAFKYYFEPTQNGLEAWPLPNPYGRVPFFAYINNGSQ
ncbi:MAG TPA: phage portal protein, partial [Abditibacteriaceae bacterium]